MKCPRCNEIGDKVVDSRPKDEGNIIRRRRECKECGYRFSTNEIVRVEKEKPVPPPNLRQVQCCNTCSHLNSFIARCTRHDVDVHGDQVCDDHSGSGIDSKLADIAIKEGSNPLNMMWANRGAKVMEQPIYAEGGDE